MVIKSELNNFLITLIKNKTVKIKPDHFIKYNVPFYKYLMLRKNNNRIIFYLPYKNVKTLVFIYLKYILSLNNELNDFKLTIINCKFNNTIKNNKLKVLSCGSFNNNEEFIGYSILNSISIDGIFNNIDISECITLVRNCGLKNYIYNKAVFRGSNYNKERDKLINYNSEYLCCKSTKNNYLSFFDYMKYKYIIDSICFKNGFSGRRFWLMHTKRLIFLPLEDKNKQFFEHSIKPYIHYIPYSVNNLDDLIQKIEYYENNPLEYNTICNNLYEYSNNNLKIENINSLIINKLNNNN